MAGKTLGNWGKWICWITYLLLLYSLIAAYIAGGAPLFLQALEGLTGVALPAWIGPFPLLFLFGIFVYLGTSAVDRINRILMFGLIGSYLFLVIFLPSRLEVSLLSHSDVSTLWIAFPVMFTSYGFHIIIPTLVTYLDRDVKRLRFAILIGSLIPFVVYAIWELLILGVVPLDGEYGLIASWQEGKTASYSLSHLLQNSWISAAANGFALFAIITSFLGVSLSLSDFLSDGLKLKRFSWEREITSLLTFLPPLFFVLTYQRGFILALQYAGIFVVILLCILPALMAAKLPAYSRPKKRALVIGVILLSLFVIGLDILVEIGMFDSRIQPYVSTES